MGPSCEGAEGFWLSCRQCLALTADDAARNGGAHHRIGVSGQFRSQTLAHPIHLISNATIDRRDRNWFRRLAVAALHNSCQRIFFDAGSRYCRVKPALPGAVSPCTHICHMQYRTLAVNQAVMPSGSGDKQVHQSAPPCASQRRPTCFNGRAWRRRRWAHRHIGPL